MYAMITTKNCPKCEKSKKVLEESNLLNKVKVLDISSQEGLDLARKYSLKMAGVDIIDTDASLLMSVDKFISLNKEGSSCLD